MVSTEIKSQNLTEEEYDKREEYFAEQCKMFRFYAIKTKLSQKLWQKKCVKHRAKDSAFQGVWQTDWEKIMNAKRR